MPTAGDRKRTPPGSTPFRRPPIRRRRVHPTRLLVACAAVALAPADLNGQTHPHADAWGVPSRPLVAMGEVVGINLVTWSFNYYVRGKEFASVYPLTWWHNIERGFRYDQNSLFMNMLAHPYHGSAYYNAARSNGIGYGGSAAMTLLGSFLWECCGERHAMAGNDVVNTTLGGIAMGEALYRTSSAVLDNEAVGAERFGRELGGFLLNPIRGINRLISGRATGVRPNPVDPDDRVPAAFTLSLDAGYREVSAAGASRGSAEGIFVDAEIDFGNPFAGRRGGPFDVFELEVTMYGGENSVLGSLQVHGNLFTKDLERGTGSQHAWALVQGYEYENTSAYRAADQTLSLRLDSLWPLAGGSWLRTRAQGGAILFGTLESPFGDLTGLGDGVRPRAFDYTAGLTGNLEAETRLGPVSAFAGWQTSWTRSINQSSRNGGAASHVIHQGRLTGRLRLWRRLALGADYRVHLRRSEYLDVPLQPLSETVPEVRLYGVWILAAGRNGPSPYLF